MAGILKYDLAKLRFFQLISDRNMRQEDRIPPERELAELFGLSLITVRRALGELEREGILERIERKGSYLKCPLKELPLIGHCLYVRIFKPEYGEEFAPDLIRNELEGRLRARSVGMTYLNAEKPDPSFARLASESMGIFVCGWLNHEWRSFLQSFGVPVVVIGENPFGDDVTTVTYDFRSASEMLTAWLIRKGCRNIALLNGGPTYAPSLQIRQGFLTALKKAPFYVGLPGRGIAPDESRMIWLSQTNLAQELDAFLSAHPDLDGIVAEAGALEALTGLLWQKNYSRECRLTAIVENRDTLRRLYSIENAAAAVFEHSLTARAVSMMFRKERAGEHMGARLVSGRKEMLAAWNMLSNR